MSFANGLHGICQNHPFIDGNKRVGANAAIPFLLTNDWGPTFDEDELVELVLSAASGRLPKAGLAVISESGCQAPEDKSGSSNSGDVV